MFYQIMEQGVLCQFRLMMREIMNLRLNIIFPSKQLLTQIDVMMITIKFTVEGTLINSAIYNNYKSKEAKNEIIKALIKSKCGEAKVNFRLRDGVFQDKDIGDAQYLFFIMKMEQLSQFQKKIYQLNYLMM